MNFKALKLLLLGGALFVQVGCATAPDTLDDAVPDLEPSQSAEDASHGWGAHVQGNPQ
jgi:hypothetical protein